MASSESTSHTLCISINGPVPNEMQAEIKATIEDIKLHGIICDVTDSVNNGVTTIIINVDCTFSTTSSIRTQLMRCIDCVFELNNTVQCQYSSQVK